MVVPVLLPVVVAVAVVVVVVVVFWFSVRLSVFVLLIDLPVGFCLPIGPTTTTTRVCVRVV